MKKSSIIILALLIGAGCSQNQPQSDAQKETPKEDKVQQNEASLERVWETDTILITNESVLYSPEEETFFVSNIIGKPTDKDGRGSISKINLAGDLTELKWAAKLDAPKGMGILDPYLYVTNIDQVVAIDLENPEKREIYPVEGAEFLNDITVMDSIVYFSDMNTGKLYKLDNDRPELVMSGLSNLNGLAAHNGFIYALTADGLLRVDPENNRIENINQKVSNGDGLVILDENTFLASRWKGEIWLIENNEATKLLDSKEENLQTADIAYYPEKNWVLVPRFFGNKVSAYRLER